MGLASQETGAERGQAELQGEVKNTQGLQDSKEAVWSHGGPALQEQRHRGPGVEAQGWVRKELCLESSTHARIYSTHQQTEPPDLPQARNRAEELGLASYKLCPHNPCKTESRTVGD